MKEKLIVGFGEALWDMLPEGRKIGGAPANFAYHVSQFGFSSCVVSAVGNDPLGDEIVADFEAKGLRSVVERVQFPTGTVEIELDPAGVPRYDIKEGAAWDNIPYTARLEELAACTRAVCFGSLVQRTEVSRGTLAKFLDAMPQDGSVLVVFDINMRQNFYSREVVRESLNRCNILKLNDEELELITPMLGLSGDSVEERCRAIIGEYGLKMLVLTCGVNGSYVFSADAQSFLPTPKVEVADTVGAGDSFTATFVASLLRGFDMAEAHRRAVAVSAFVCSQKGAMPVLLMNINYRLMKKLIYCICAAGLLVLGACGTKNNDKADDAYATDEACAKCTAAGIEGKWVIDEILCGKQFVKPAAENGERMYISFAADSTVNCYTGCNAIGGAYFVAGDSIRFDYMMRTEMACPDMEVEDTISVMLPRVATFAIEGDTLLKLNTATPGEQIVLSRAAVTEE